MASLVHPTVGKVLLVKPTTFVNRSGQAAQALCSYYEVAPQDLFILSDDIHLDLGTLRLSGEGGHGGHNGLRDIIAHLERACRACVLALANLILAAIKWATFWGPFIPKNKMISNSASQGGKMR